MKKTISRLLVILLFISTAFGMIPSVNAKTVSKAAVKKKYAAFLKKNKETIKRFQIVYISDDKQPSLVADSADSGLIEPDISMMVKVYHYVNGKVKYMGAAENDSSSHTVYYRKGWLFTWGNCFDTHNFSKYRIKNGKLMIYGVYDNLYAPEYANRVFKIDALSSDMPSDHFYKTSDYATYQKNALKTASSVKMKKNSSKNREKLRGTTQSDN